ncbi:MAG: phosphoenolpyruvate--protein phosphotransferase [Lachnospiraceae bacterium]|nr:phosphoenolpyruvate--protein phosphotransferase [Lachnospiraceae bacterium]
MQVYQGKSVYEGIVIGRIQIYQKKEQQVKPNYVTDVAGEHRRLEAAVNEVTTQLTKLHEKAKAELGEEDAAIFEMHLLLVKDADYLGFIEKVIQTQMVNAEYAVAVAAEYFIARFSAMDDEYMKERAADVRDVSDHLLAVLTSHSKGVPASMGRLCDALKADREPVIILADDLAPSQTMQLDREKVLAFVTVYGSVNSHTAILARTMNIPALVGTCLISGETEKGQSPHNVAGALWMDGHLAIVDGDSGCLYVDPDPKTRQCMEAKLAMQQEKKALLLALKGKETITLGGCKINICANIGGLSDLQQAVQNDAEGIGLFRSECLYLEKDTHPTEEEQFERYKTVVESMEGKQVIIRTLDIGADKQLNYIGLTKEDNPALGCRAIRACLKHPEIFKTQLRALFRAGVYGKLAVMYPMITSLQEVHQIKTLTEQVKAELAAEGIAYAHIEQGIMIETPAAAMISDLLAKEVDFFSIGTNDLAQYTLAIDRQNGELDEFYDARHEAVLRMIRMTVENAHKAGIRCGVCGELAADPAMTEFFLDIGVEELSVSPAMILPLRKVVREMER